MNTLVLPFAVVCSLGLAGVGLSFLAFVQAKTSAGMVERRTRARQEKLEAAIEAAKQTVTGLASQVQDIQDHRQQAPITALPPMPKNGLNLSKRSQALRMHRLGESPDKIASSLEVPRQEIDLLLRVVQVRRGADEQAVGPFDHR